MPKLGPLTRFRDGDVISTADIDANFAAVATLINTTKLGADNFRPLSGIHNARKVFSRRPVPLLAVLPKITSSATGSQDHRGILSYPHFAQYPQRPTDMTGQNGNVTEKNALVGGNYVALGLNAFGCYHGGTGVIAGDALQLILNYRKLGSAILSTQTCNIKNDNVLVVTSITDNLVPIDYMEAFVRWTPADAGARTVNHITAGLYLYHPDIP